MRALALALAALAAAARPAPSQHRFLKETGPPPDELPDDACTNWYHEGTCFKNDDWDGEDAYPQTSDDVYDADDDWGDDWKDIIEDALGDDGLKSMGECSGCGYGPADTVGRSSDCVACTDGYRLFHVYEDCTGFCVDDEAYEALKDYCEANGIIHKWNPFDGDSDCKPWPLDCDDEDEGGNDDEASPEAFCSENGFDDWEDDWKDDRTAYRNADGDKVRCSSIVEDEDATWARCCCGDAPCGNQISGDTDYCCQDSLAPEDCKTTAEGMSPEEAFCTANDYEFDGDSWKDDRTAYRDEDGDKIRCSNIVEDEDKTWARCCCKDLCGNQGADTDYCCQDSLDPDECLTTAEAGTGDDATDDATPGSPEAYCKAASYDFDADIWKDDRTAYRDADGDKVRCSAIAEADDATWARCCCQDTDYCCQDTFGTDECLTTAEAGALPTPRPTSASDDAENGPEAFCAANGYDADGFDKDLTAYRDDDGEKIKCSDVVERSEDLWSRCCCDDDDYCCKDSFGKPECLTTAAAPTPRPTDATATDDETSPEVSFCSANGYTSVNFDKDTTAYKDDGDKVKCEDVVDNGENLWARCCCDDDDYCCKDTFGTPECLTTAAAPTPRPTEAAATDDDEDPAEAYCSANGYDADGFDKDLTAYRDSDKEKIKCSDIVEAEDDLWAKCCCDDDEYCCKDTFGTDECLTTTPEKPTCPADANVPDREAGEAFCEGSDFDTVEKCHACGSCCRWDEEDEGCFYNNQFSGPSTDCPGDQEKAPEQAFCEANDYDPDGFDKARTAYRDEADEKIKCGDIVDAGDDLWARCCCDDDTYCCKDTFGTDECLTTAPEQPTCPTDANVVDKESGEAFCEQSGFDEASCLACGDCCEWDPDEEPKCFYNRISDDEPSASCPRTPDEGPTPEKYCSANGYDADGFDKDLTAYKDDGDKVKCGEVVEKGEDLWATCCCDDDSYCCKDTSGTDECKTTAGDPAPTPAPKNCPVVQPVQEKDCPADGTVYAFSCDKEDLKVGDVCKANNGECFTDKKLDNCVYQGKKADLYDVVKESGSDEERFCRAQGYFPYDFDSDRVAYVDDDEADVTCDAIVTKGDLSRASCCCAACGCGDSVCETTAKPTVKGTPKPTQPLGKCAPDLTPVGDGTPYPCPSDGQVRFFTCRNELLLPGDLCTPGSQNECGTDPDLNNCFYQGKTRDVYRVGGEKPPLPDGCPELLPVARAACPNPGEVDFFDCAAPGLNAWGMLCKSNDAECLTSKELNNCDYQGDKDSDIYVVKRPAGEIEDVDTTIRFLPGVLEAQYPDYATDPASKEALADALVASKVAVMNGISKVDWLAEEFVDDGSTDDFQDDQRRRLETYESVPARVRVRVPLSTVSDTEAADLSRTIARRVKAAVNGDNVPALKDTLAAVSEPLAAALDVDGTDRSADADTVVVGAETREPTRQPTRFPTRQPTIRPTVRPGEPTAQPQFRPTDRPTSRPTPEPTDAPGGGGSKKKSDKEIISGMDDAGAIVLILFLCLLGCCLLGALAYYCMSSRDQENEKNKRALYGDNEDPFRVDDVDRDLELTHATPSRSGSWDRESRHEAEDDQGGWPDSLGAAPGHEEHLAVQPGAEASPLFSPGGDTYVDDDNMSFAVRKSNICRRAANPRFTTLTPRRRRSFATGAVGGGAAAASAYGASAYGHNDDMTMATEAQSTYHHGDDMTMATHDAGFDQMVEDEISKRSGAGFA